MNKKERALVVERLTQCAASRQNAAQCAVAHRTIATLSWWRQCFLAHVRLESLAIGLGMQEEAHQIRHAHGLVGAPQSRFFASRTIPGYCEEGLSFLPQPGEEG